MKPADVTALLALLAVPAAATAKAKPYTRNVAIVVYEHAEPLDWTGPFEVYNDAANIGSSNGQPAFHVYVVSKTKEPLNKAGEMVYQKAFAKGLAWIPAGHILRMSPPVIMEDEVLMKGLDMIDEAIGETERELRY